VVSEGIAVNALRAVMTPDETEAWLTGDLAALAGLDADDIRAFLAVTQVRRALGGVSG
jgi:hypothetical protein